MNEQGILVGFLLFVVIILPLLIIRDQREKRKIRKILEAHRNGTSGSREAAETGAGGPGLTNTGAKGWGMNASPFRTRKSGLRWGGGNIKASEASRPARRQFGKGR